MDGFLDLYLQFNIPSPVEEATWRHWFEIWLKELGVQEPCELSLCLTSDEHIRQLNREFRHLDESTDVLAFAAQEMLAPFGIQDITGVRLLGLRPAIAKGLCPTIVLCTAVTNATASRSNNGASVGSQLFRGGGGEP